MLMDTGNNQCATCGHYGPRSDFIYDGIESICTCKDCLKAYDERVKTTPAGF